MFSHVKETIQPVTVNTPDPQFGQYLLEQFGGATGELTAALHIGCNRSMLRTRASAICCRILPWKNSAILRWSAS